MEPLDYNQQYLAAVDRQAQIGDTACNGHTIHEFNYDSSRLNFKNLEKIGPHGILAREKYR